MKKSKKQCKKMSLKTKDRLLTTASVFTVITPLLVTLGINFNEYFIARGAGVQVGFGGALAILLVVLLAKDKLTVFKGVWGYLVVFLLAVFLKPIIDDIVLLTGMALTGKAADSIFIQIPLRRVRGARGRTEQANTSNNSDFIKMIDDRLKQYGGKRNE